MKNKELIEKTTWLPKCDLEAFGQYLYRFKCIQYDTLNWQKSSFVKFCSQNKIQSKGTRAKRIQRNHFWFSTNVPKGAKDNDIAHHFLRHIRNAFAHCNISITYEGRAHHKFYKLEDYDKNGSKCMSGKIRSDYLWTMIDKLLP